MKDIYSIVHIKATAKERVKTWLMGLSLAMLCAAIAVLVSHVSHTTATYIASVLAVPGVMGACIGVCSYIFRRSPQFTAGGFMYSDIRYNEHNVSVPAKLTPISSDERLNVYNMLKRYSVKAEWISKAYVLSCGDGIMLLTDGKHHYKVFTEHKADVYTEMYIIHYGLNTYYVLDKQFLEKYGYSVANLENIVKSVRVGVHGFTEPEVLITKEELPIALLIIGTVGFGINLALMGLGMGSVITAVVTAILMVGSCTVALLKDIKHTE